MQSKLSDSQDCCIVSPQMTPLKLQLLVAVIAAVFTAETFGLCFIFVEVFDVRAETMKPETAEV